jgi:hypothetical protein
MGACHWERARVLQRVQEAKERLEVTLQESAVDPQTVKRLQQELLRASEALARLPDCSE